MTGSWHILTWPLRLTFLDPEAARTIMWTDELCSGPVPSGLSFRALTHRRSEFWRGVESRRTPRPNSQMMEAMRAQSTPPPWRYSQESIDVLQAAEEIVIWLGEGPGSQLAMLQCVELVTTDIPVSVVTKVSSSRDHSRTEEAYQARTVLSTDVRLLLSKLWQHFRSPSPIAFHELIRSVPESFGGLRSLGKKFPLLFPAKVGGVDDLLLKVLSAASSRSFSLAECVGKALSGTGMGDTYLFDRVFAEFSKRTPLLALDGCAFDPASTVSMMARPLVTTHAGDAVLRGERDAIELNGIDTWVGGCHISSKPRSGFRWCEHQQEFSEL